MEHTFALSQKAQQGDREAKDALLRENSGLIWSVVRRFGGRGAEPEDLYQIGAIGLLKCIEKFDFAYDVKFSTYAVPMVMGEIRRFLRDDGAVKVSRSLKELAFRAKRLQEKKMLEESREMTMQELAEALGAEKEEIVLALEAGREVESLYAAAGGGEDNALRLIDKLPDTEDNEKMLDRISLKEAMGTLDEKERQIIWMRYFQDRTQADVAKEIGISQVQVSRIEKKTLLRMRRAME